MSRFDGAAVVHGNVAYFSRSYYVYCYKVADDDWIRLPKCNYEWFALAVIKDMLTTIGGDDSNGVATNSLHSLSDSVWKQAFPPMSTSRVCTAAVSTSTHLVVAGGRLDHQSRAGLASVEVMNTETLQWSIASGLPNSVDVPQMTLCGESLYLCRQDTLFSCLVEDLLKNSRSVPVWTKLADVPLQCSSITTLAGRVLAVGGAENALGDNPRGIIHHYDVTSNSWSVIGELSTPRCGVLTAVFPSNKLVVAGGISLASAICTLTDIFEYS